MKERGGKERICIKYFGKAETNTKNWKLLKCSPKRQPANFLAWLLLSAHTDGLFRKQQRALILSTWAKLQP